jgi:eukaryotic-like serine/threonine-protein kinase
MIGQTISHYRITDKLGAGGMGVVYKASDLKLERTVALKFLPHDLTVSTRDKASLLREARAASALDHPNIGVIHEIAESEDHQVFIVMGYYEGETLAQKLSRGAIPVRESLDLAIQIARGLGAAHARNIVHRDVKPSNIVITKDGTAKIVDFGLARVVASISSTQSISSTGTLPYMSPEQILGEPIDQRADLWALGVLLLQMNSGTHPFVRPNPGAMTFAILNQPPAGVDLLPEAARPIAYRALSKKPDGRYPTAEEMLHDLESARAEIVSGSAPADEPTLTHPIGARELKHYMDNASTPRWTAGQTGKSRRLLFASLGIAVAVIVAFFFPPLRERFAGLAYAGGEKHIAVLPFANSPNDPEYQPVAEGLMDSMTNQLSNLDAAQQSLWVVPASIVRKHKVNDPASAFRELGATMVVQGSVQRKGSTVHMTVVLIDSKRLRQIGSADLEDRSGDLAALQDQAVTHMARLMKVKVPEVARGPSGSVAPNAYESYLKALGYIQRYDKPGNLDRAISNLNSAVKTDPRFALGFATLGEAYRLKYQTEHHPGWLAEAATNCQKAIQIDDHLAAAHVTLGYLNISLAKTDLALQEFQKALNINPRDASAVMGMASAYENMDHVAEAETNYKRAIALRPDYWDGYTALGNFYDRQNRVQDAIAQYQRVIELTPDNAEAYSNLGTAYMSINDSQSNAAAEAALQKSIQLSPNYAAYANLGFLHMTEKRYADCVRDTRQALVLNDKDWRVWSNLMVAYQWLRDDENYRTVRAKTLSLVEEYASANPQEASVQSALSTLYAEDKLHKKAIARVDSALALAPKDPSVLGDIAETYEDLGDRKKALQYAEQSLKSGSTLDDLQRRFALQGLLADPSFRSGGKH